MIRLGTSFCLAISALLLAGCASQHLLAVKDRDIRELRLQNGRKQEALVRSLKTAESLRDQVDTLEYERRELQREVASLNTSVEFQRQTADRLDGENTRLRGKLREAELTQERLRQSHDDLKKVLNSTVKQIARPSLGASLGEGEPWEIGRLRAQLNELRAQLLRERKRAPAALDSAAGTDSVETLTRLAASPVARGDSSLVAVTRAPSSTPSWLWPVIAIGGLGLAFVALFSVVLIVALRRQTPVVVEGRSSVETIAVETPGESAAEPDLAPEPPIDLPTVDTEATAAEFDAAFEDAFGGNDDGTGLAVAPSTDAQPAQDSEFINVSPLRSDDSVGASGGGGSTGISGGVASKEEVESALESSWESIVPNESATESETGERSDAPEPSSSPSDDSPNEDAALNETSDGRRSFDMVDTNPAAEAEAEATASDGGAARSFADALVDTSLQETALMSTLDWSEDDGTVEMRPVSAPPLEARGATQLLPDPEEHEAAMGIGAAPIPPAREIDESDAEFSHTQVLPEVPATPADPDDPEFSSTQLLPDVDSNVFSGDVNPDDEEFASTQVLPEIVAATLESDQLEASASDERPEDFSSTQELPGISPGYATAPDREAVPRAPGDGATPVAVTTEADTRMDDRETSEAADATAETFELDELSQTKTDANDIVLIAGEEPGTPVEGEGETVVAVDEPEDDGEEYSVRLLDDATDDASPWSSDELPDVDAVPSPTGVVDADSEHREGSPPLLDEFQSTQVLDDQVSDEAATRSDTSLLDEFAPLVDDVLTETQVMDAIDLPLPSESSPSTGDEFAHTGLLGDTSAFAPDGHDAAASRELIDDLEDLLEKDR